MPPRHLRLSSLLFSIDTFVHRYRSLSQNILSRLRSHAHPRFFSFRDRCRSERSSCTPFIRSRTSSCCRSVRIRTREQYSLQQEQHLSRYLCQCVQTPIIQSSMRISGLTPVYRWERSGHQASQRSRRHRVPDLGNDAASQTGDADRHDPRQQRLAGHEGLQHGPFVGHHACGRVGRIQGGRQCPSQRYRQCKSSPDYQSGKWADGAPIIGSTVPTSRRREVRSPSGSALVST